MEFRILGPFEVVGEDGPVDLGGPKVRTLLAALVVKAGHVVSADRLVEILWGPEPADAAPRTLQSHISHLRSALERGRPGGGPGGLLLTREPGYVLAVDPEQVDAVRFERLVRQGRRSLDAGAAETAAAELRQALELWRGEPLADFAFEPFAQGEIARLSELRLQAVEDRLEADLASGRHAEVGGELQTLVGEHPLRERLWGQLMLALYRQGRQAEALRAFSRLREILAEQLGIDPSPEVARLEESILLQKPELDWQPPPPASAPRLAPPETGPAEGEPSPRGRTGPELVEAGRRAFARRSWEEAFELLRAADQSLPLGTDDLEAMGWAAFWSGRSQETVAIAQRVHTIYMEAGDRRRAGWAAVMVCLLHAAQLRISVAAGWYAMASQLLQDEPEGVEHGYLSWTTTTVLVVLGKGDAVAALESAERTLDIATRFDDSDLRAVALTYKGYVLVRQGETAEGLALLDEAMAAAVAGTLIPLSTATVICRTLSTCVDLYDFRRAGEWLDAVQHAARPAGMAGFPGDCRIHHAQVLVARGDWSHAEIEARRACAEMDDFVREHVGLAFYTVGEILRLRGDLDGAEEAFRRADELGRTPQPGRALVQLARGDTDAAAASIRRALKDEPWDLLARARLLAAQVEIAAATSDLSAARGAAVELDQIASRYGTPGLRAASEHAQGVTLLAEGRPSEAASLLEHSWRRWREMGATYDAARARLELGVALHAQGDRLGGAFECEEARRSFEWLGARLDVKRALELPASGATLESSSGMVGRG